MSELLGWVILWTFGFAMLNFVLKRVDKYVIVKIKNENSKIVVLFRKIMKIFVKNHRYFGMAVFVAVLTHFFYNLSIGLTSISGFISAVIMLLIVLLGLYGFFISKNMKGLWLKFHRIIAFLVVIAIGLHVL